VIERTPTAQLAAIRWQIIRGVNVSTHQPFFPHPIFSVEDIGQPSVPRVLIAPHRYIQGEGVLDHLGRYLSLISSKRAAVFISEGGQRRLGKQILQSLEQAQVQSMVEIFRGECSTEEVDRAAAVLNSEAAPVDCLIAIGGGKCLDAGKCVAFRLSVPVVVCPTIASTDAPCSAQAVMYTPEGVFNGVEFFPNSPAIVVVDTRIIIQAPVRYLVAGMGDALATWYEARTCFRNSEARSTVGAHMTLAALTIAELCAKTVFEYGLAAAAAVRQAELNDAFERVVEANTLLSSVGFESGGLAAAHAVAGGLTVLPALHQHLLHGEKVALGLLTQLALEDELDEAKRVAVFLARVGLPVHLGQLGLDPENDVEALKAVTDATLASLIIHNEPFEVTPEKLLTALSQVHQLGLAVTASIGDEAYRELHAE
jgi:glycerol dehydrogenase